MPDVVRLDPDAMQFQWTAPTVQHELRIVRSQGTATTWGDLRDAIIRVFCHWTIDHLPQRAHKELVSSLLAMLDFYHGAPPEDRTLPPRAKSFAGVVRSTRPEIVLSDEE